MASNPNSQLRSAQYYETLLDMLGVHLQAVFCLVFFNSLPPQGGAVALQKAVGAGPASALGNGDCFASLAVSHSENSI